MVVVAMMIQLIDMTFDNGIPADMREYLRVHSSNCLYRLLFVNSRQWNNSNIKSMYSPSAPIGFHTEADIEFEVTANELLMLQLENKYLIEEVVNA
jgi:hypothetical protein